ncbi:hypothetical protein ABZZ79_32115 [Streptomyces sp. NPDC006458]
MLGISPVDRDGTIGDIVCSITDRPAAWTGDEVRFADIKAQG